jgi:hypothetical protein
VVVNRHGKPIAVLMGLHDQDEPDRLVFASSRRLQDILEAADRKSAKVVQFPNEEFWSQVEAEQGRE